MMGTTGRTGYHKWLDQMFANLKRTPKGVRLSLTVYVYPDGHGNLYYLNPEGKTIDEMGGQPVNNIEEAVEAFRSVWEQATGYSPVESAPKSGG